MTRHEILDSAKACVCGQREQDYGSPEDNFRLIADLWQPYIKSKCVGAGAVVDIEPTDVAMLMALLKIARIATGSGTTDSFVDLAGYAACGGEIAANARDFTKTIALNGAARRRPNDDWGAVQAPAEGDGCHAERAR